MNSFTNPPQHTRKFQFDTDFQKEEERLRQEAHQAEHAVHEPAEIEPQAPSFSEAQLSSAQEEAFRQGFEQGKNEARNSIENGMKSMLNVIINALDALQAGEDQRLMQMSEVVLRTTIATLKKMWPTIIQNQALEIVEHTVRQSLEYNPEETRIVIRVHDTMLDPLIQHLPQIQAQKAFGGKIIALADQTVGPADCKVEWADGGMERLSRTISSQIDLALERVLTNLKATSQNADTERTSQ